MTTQQGLIILMLFFVMPGNGVKAQGLFSDLPGLSPDARDSLVAHFDGRENVETSGGNNVISWTPLDGDGNPLTAMKVTALSRPGGGDASLITYDLQGALSFDDSTASAEGRYLEGDLANGGGTALTVFWRGHYDGGTPFETSGTYAYNIGLNNVSHQRDDGAGGFVAELYNGTTYSGTVDITPFDDAETVWSTVVTANSHVAYANGTNLGIPGAPSYNIAANAEIVIGAFSSGGFDFVGDISQLIVFESALSEADRQLVETYLAKGLNQNPTSTDGTLTISKIDEMIELTWDTEKGILHFSPDLKNWQPLLGATSPLRKVPETSEFFRLMPEIDGIPEGFVTRTRITSDTFRELEYHLDTGALFFVGEKSHGLDQFTTRGNNFWWCTMNSKDRGSGLLEFLMDRNENAEAMKSEALAAGWPTYSSSAFITFEPLTIQETFVNLDSRATQAYTDDYRVVSNENLLFVLYRTGGAVYLGIGGPSLNAIEAAIPPGDGSSDRDNGVRTDVAFKAVLPLSEADKLEMIKRFAPVVPKFNESSGAYDYVHPPGL